MYLSYSAIPLIVLGLNASWGYFMRLVEVRQHGWCILQFDITTYGFFNLREVISFIIVALVDWSFILHISRSACISFVRK